MTRWLIELVGERLDTEEFPYWFPDGDVCAVELDGKHYLTGSVFDKFDDGGPVRAAAAEALKGMSATISLLWPTFIPPEVGGVLREHNDGRRDIWLFAEGGLYRSKVRGVAIVIGGITPAEPQKTQAQELLRAGQASSHLREALEVWSDKYRSWGRLHRVLEEIERHLGKQVNQADFCSANERERFTRSANCSEVAGIDARHASGKFDPPPQPMSLQEAEGFIRQMLDKALRAILTQLPPV
jgi:hypothetical protein